ncbi:MAG: hypothetical protein EB084_01315 [Proteobacteria bacterium]|nr:hypothetical protein [Pseudomonadota bacterium]
MSARRSLQRARGRRGAPTRGSALLLTMFTIVALLTLGTTFIAISVGESRQTRNDRELQAARGVAMYGINWLTSYMSLPGAWRAASAYNASGASYTGRDKATGYADKLYTLQGTDTSQADDANNKKISWMGRTLDIVPATVTDDSNGYPVFVESIGALTTAIQGGAVVQLTADLIGVFDLEFSRLTPDASNSNKMQGQPAQYKLKSTAYVFHQADTTGLYVTENGKLKPNMGKAAAVRSITVRIRPQSPVDFALYESNMRSWTTPGINAQYGDNSYADNGLTVNDASQKGLLQQLFNTVELDTVGIPKDYKLNGNMRADGSLTPGDKFASKAGSLKVLASQADLNSVQINGNSSGFAAKLYANQNLTVPTSPSGTQPDAFSFTDANISDADKSKIFGGQKSPTFASTTRGLPALADYMTGYVVQNSATDASCSSATGAPQLKAGWASQVAQQDSLGYIKVATPGTGAVAVTSSTNTGSDVEFDNTSSSPIKAPGVARVKITFSTDTSGNSKVTVRKIGAYSGKDVDTSGVFDPNGHSVSEFKNGMLYVDGGNVEVEGTAPPNFTVVAAASSDRPTVATPAKMVNGVLTPQQGQPVLIRPDDQTNLTRNGGGIYVDGETKIGGNYLFPHDPISGAITQVPVLDPVSNKYVWPAYDPSKIGTQCASVDSSGNLITSTVNVKDSNGTIVKKNYNPSDPSAITSEAPLVREGNVSITGNITKPMSGATGSFGIVAQNYILLSDQSSSKSTTSAELKVDGVLMSMTRSVQYGGFLNQVSSTSGNGNNPYYRALGAQPDATTGAIKGSIPRPRLKYKGSNKFTLNGSIVGQYADVESTTDGTGYITQNINSDLSLRSALPPMLPTFSREQLRAPITWVVVALGDSAGTKAGTK